MTTRASTLPVPKPIIELEASPYWEAASRGELLVPYCGRCHQHFWYPRGFCPTCGADEVEWRPASGRGQVYSFSVVRRALAAWRDATPYVVALIALEDGPVVNANIVGADALDTQIDDMVTAVFEHAPHHADDQANDAGDGAGGAAGGAFEGPVILRFERTHPTNSDSREGVTR